MYEIKIENLKKKKKKTEPVPCKKYKQNNTYPIRAETCRIGQTRDSTKTCSIKCIY